MKEYITDGRQYFSKDGKKTYSAKTYYKKVEEDIKSSAKLLPIMVIGDVGWVVVQTSPKHLRLTLVDHGYINPDDRDVEVHFNTIHPHKVVDILTKESFDVPNNPHSIKITVPTGSFRFIDIELTKKL